MHELRALYRIALRSGDPALRERADLELQALPRSPPRSSAAGERIVRALLWRLRS